MEPRLRLFILQNSPTQKNMSVPTQKLSQPQLQQLCQQCCFSIDNPTKRRIQLTLNQFFINITLEQIQYLLLNSSQIVLFVMSQYLFNNISIYKEYRPLAMLLTRGLESWRADVNLFVRNGERMKPFALNTYVKLLGEVVKRVFNEGLEGKKWVYGWMGGFEANMQLLLWKYFLERVDEIDSSMGFLAYRNMIYAFQDQTMVKILDVTIPFFNQLAEAVKFNELSALQANLSVNQVTLPIPRRTLNFTSQQLSIAQVVLQLLRLITSYRYNITFSQYDLESHYQNCAICFPQKVKTSLLSNDLYESLFFLAQRFIIESPQHELLKTCLNCLQKIVLCRVHYDKKQLRREFTDRSLRGITRLMVLVGNGGNGENGDSLQREFVDFNRKMISNQPLKKFRKVGEQGKVFTEWLRENQRYYMRVIAEGDLVFQSEQFQEAFDLLIKIVDQSSNFKLESYRPVIKQMCLNIFNQLLRRILSNNHNLFNDIILLKVKHIKRMTTELFTCARILFGLNPIQNSQTLLTCLSTILSNFLTNSNNPNQVTNFLLLQMQIQTSETYIHNILKEQIPQLAQQALGKCLADTFKFIEIFMSRKVAVEDSSNSYMSMAVLLFVEKVLYETLTGVVTSQRTENGAVVVTTTSRLYNQMGVTALGQGIDQFLEFGFTTIMQFMKAKDIRLIEYCMECLSTCLTKFKLALNRQIFKQMQLPKAIFRFCLQVAKQQFKTIEVVKCRINLFKIITIVGFDDCLDNYRQKLRTVFENLHLNCDNENFFILIYDLRGMASQIDAGPVYRFFLSKVMPMIKTIFTSLLIQNQSDKVALMKHSLKLCKVLLENKSQRLSLTKTIPLSYQLVSNLLPYWQVILTELTRQQTHNFQAELPIACQLFRIFTEMMRGNYINFFLLAALKPRQTQSYTLNLLKYICAAYQQVPNYPKVFEQCVTVCMYLSRDLSEFIFTYNSQQIILAYCDMFMVSFKLLQIVLKQHLNGNSKNQRHLDKLLDVMIASLTYTKTSLTQTHKSPNCSNSQLFKSTHYSQRLQIIVSLFESALQQLKALSIFSQITRLLNLFITLYPESYEMVKERFMVNYQVSRESQMLETIYRRNVENDKEGKEKEHDPESFSGYVAEWLKEIDAKAQANATVRAEIIEY